MAKPELRWEWKNKGFRQVLNSPGVRAAVQRKAEDIAAAAGDGFKAFTIRGRYGGGRTVAFVHPTTYEAREAEATDKALSRAAARRS